MSKFVIAGKSNCPYFAKAELVGDQLARNLPEFKVHKILKDPKDWDNWLKEICAKNKWKHTRSPIIWRELVDRGGKGMLLGDHNDFQQYAFEYYGVNSDLMSIDLKKISSENERFYKDIEEERLRDLAKIQPLILTISNPDSNILYYIINEILNGSVFGPTDISIRLYVTSSDLDLDGIKMEIEDLASPYLRNVKIVSNAEEAFINCDFALLFDELLPADDANLNDDKIVYTNPYISLAKDINKYAKKTCKILITPFESRSEIYALCTIFSQHLKGINSKINLIGNSMYDIMLAKAILASRLNVNQAFIKNVTLFGQSIQEDSYFIDLSYGKVTNYNGAVWARSGTHWLSLLSMLADKEWVLKDFLDLVQNRENTIKEKLKRQAILTFAQSIVNLMRLWCNKDHRDDGIYSVIVNANGNYMLKDDIFMSVPLKFENGEFFFIKNYRLSGEIGSVLKEIIRDTQRKITSSNNKVNELYTKDAREAKLSIPHVLFE